MTCLFPKYLRGFKGNIQKARVWNLPADTIPSTRNKLGVQRQPPTLMNKYSEIFKPMLCPAPQTLFNPDLRSATAAQEGYSEGAARRVSSADSRVEISRSSPTACPGWFFGHLTHVVWEDKPQLGKCLYQINL